MLQVLLFCFLFFFNEDAIVLYDYYSDADEGIGLKRICNHRSKSEPCSEESGGACFEPFHIRGWSSSEMMSIIEY
jgi:hypothetical protein